MPSTADTDTTARRPQATTHAVTNQPPPYADRNLWRDDLPLREAAERHGAAWDSGALDAFGARCGRAETLDLGFAANENPPRLVTHDRYGHRIDEVAFHPAYHQLMHLGLEAGIAASPWAAPRTGAHVARAARHYLLTQVEASVLCPMTMSFAAVPALRAQADVGTPWIDGILRAAYDPRLTLAADKAGLTVGMAMTEKQGGSDVRANTTRAEPEGAPGRGRAYRLTGHKWFCSAPMSDAFLTLARTAGAQTGDGLSCFLVPRVLDDGTRNVFRLQRLKDKLGNRANASSEVEYDGTLGWMIGEPGRGVPAIIEMVAMTRLDCVIGSAAIMRQALAQALHHTAHRRAFGRRLAEQPLMRRVLADLALEVEAATALALRLAAAYDAGDHDAGERAFFRLATAAAKYWVTKRTPPLVAEALECLGGNGYVEESVMPRLYREAPLNSIWEGSGNVMCLDVLRAARREPETLPAMLAEIARGRGENRRFDAYVDALEGRLPRPGDDADSLAAGARRLTEHLALALQASLLLRHAPAAVASAFVASRLGGESGLAFGTLPSSVDTDAILARAWPAG